MSVVWYCINVAFTSRLQALQSPDSMAQSLFIVATSYVVAVRACKSVHLHTFN
jgi:hypothetical protein